VSAWCTLREDHARLCALCGGSDLRANGDLILHPDLFVVTRVLAECRARDLSDIVTACAPTGHHFAECDAVLGAVKASSLRSDAAFRGASDLDRASAQRVNVALT
jgi:hypothetical protein